MRKKWCAGVGIAGALAAIATSVAVAAPSGEFGRCVKQTGGKYGNSGCTTPSSKGSYEWLPGPGPKNHFAGVQKEGTLATLETVKGTKITCKKSHGTGEFKNAHEVANVVATFEECETSKIPCQSEGEATGVIVTSPLEGATGVEKLGETPATDKMAQELHGPGGGALAKFGCAGLTVVVSGSILHPVVADRMLTSTTEKFSASRGEQKPDRYAGGTEDEHTLASSTNGATPEESGQTITAFVHFEEPIELNSTL